METFSDTGNHFRALEWLGGALRLMNDKKINFTTNWMAECHGKCRCDALFGTVQSWRKDAAAKVLITTIPQLVTLLQERADHECSINPQRPKIYFEEWLPPPKAGLMRWRLRPASAPVGIMAAHSWRFVINDRRRHDLRGTGGDRHKLTGISARTFVVANPLTQCDRVWTPEIDNLFWEEDPEADAQSTSLCFDTKVWNGWRLAYRTQRPDEEPPARVLPRLAKKHLKVSAELSRVARGRRHAPRDLQLARVAAARARLRISAKRWLAGVRPLPEAAAPPPFVPDPEVLSLFFDG